MKTLKLALIAAMSVASISAQAAVAAELPAEGAKASDCYYEFSVITADAIYDFYTCYSNGDGSY